MIQTMQRILVVLAVLLFPAFSLPIQAAGPADKLARANEVLAYGLDRGIPPALLARAKAVAIFPDVVKGSLIWGARHGEGVILSRAEDGTWSGPAFFTITGGSWGIQAGIRNYDVVLLIMNDRGLGALLNERVTLGGDIGITLGPTGPMGEADVDMAMRAEVLSYSWGRGLHVGASVQSAVLLPKSAWNREVYGRAITPAEILIQRSAQAPESARGLIETLGRSTAR